MTTRTTRLLSVIVTLLILALPRTASAGYTHYWKWKTEPDAGELSRCIEEMQKLADARREILEGWNGRTGSQAEFRSTCAFGDAGVLPCLGFNGIGDDAHETFTFPLAAFGGTPAFSFVKTANKPYDEVVSAALIVARDHFPPSSLEILSDGRWIAEWQPGASLYERVLRRPARNPLTEPPSSFPNREPDPTAQRAAWSFKRKALAVLIGLLLLAILELLRRR